MGHGKLKKFAENETFRCLLQPDASAVLAKEPGCKELKLNDHPIKGNWGREMFGNDHPIVLELGCGKGDYTIALAQWPFCAPASSSSRHFSAPAK